MIIWYILIFIASCFALSFCGSWLVRGLTKIAHILGWREYVTAFIIMAFAASLPNLFVGLNAAFKGIPELSLGDILGGNLVDITIVAALAVLIAGKPMVIRSKMVETSAIFAVIIAIIPIILLLDGRLSRADGLVLILLFCLYLAWLFHKQERFKKEYHDKLSKEEKLKTTAQKTGEFFKNLGMIVGALGLLCLASEAIVRTASYFAQQFNLPLITIGLIVVGLGNALPETYFTIISARKKEFYLILGDLFGSIIVPATLVLGTVILVHPIVIDNFSSLLTARLFLLVGALLFLTFLRTGKSLSRREAIILLFLYVLFLVVEIVVK